MEPSDPEVVATRDDVVAGVLSGAEDAREVLALLDAAGSVAEAVVDVPLVDESERVRLEHLAGGDAVTDPRWSSIVARRDGRAVGYGGVLVPETRGGAATGDVAVARERPPSAPVLSVLLAGLEGLGWERGAGRLVVWLRHATAPDLDCASAAGFGIERRLGVLGRPLRDVSTTPLPRGLEVRPYRPDEDDEAVVAVLAAAYGGTADEGWTLERFRERRAYDWFRPDDLLVADAGRGELQGLHWLKRRGDGVGEVYNLAIAPEAQGSGLGAALLTAGLAHLAATGIDDVVLWVDLANERAVRLYAAHGFATRWEDLALARTLRGTPDA